MWNGEKHDELTHSFKDPSITHLYKHTGSRRICDNHRGISLLELAGNILARICLNRLQSVPLRTLPLMCNLVSYLSPSVDLGRLEALST